MSNSDDARFIGLQVKGPLTGRRLLVRYSPSDAVQLGASQLFAQGFSLYKDNLSVALKAEGSAWTAQALRIGDSKKSWQRGFVANLVEQVFPVDLIPGLRRTIAPTIVIVTARVLPSDTNSSEVTELFIVPLSSKSGDPSSAFGAAPLVRAVIAEVISIAEGQGALISADKPILGVSDPDCPASRSKATQLLGSLK